MTSNKLSKVADLGGLTLRELGEMYYRLTGQKVRKFSDKQTACKRVAQALEKQWKIQARSNYRKVDAPAGHYWDDEQLDFMPLAAKPGAEPDEPDGGEGSRAKGKRLGIGKFMAECIRKDLDTQTILAKVHKKFPLSKARAADVSIVRSKVKKGLL